MDDIFVGRVMSDSLHTVRPDTLVEDAAQVMLDNDVGSVVVVDDDNRLAGILTRTDFVTIVSESHPKAETSVSRYMTTDVVTASAQDSVQDVADTMLAEGFHHMPVVDDDEGLIGMITTTDLAAYIAQVRTSNP
ncbi:CBS domain-containing protein [Halorientalis salina]|uniref:CBS domain-containing protein n=1 Tax=Halorientalis salina TaxID=2932266 RepID=UPI0010AC3C68|nr:CBS domain-containing protein [Halorientalis salina]